MDDFCLSIISTLAYAGPFPILDTCSRARSVHVPEPSTMHALHKVDTNDTSSSLGGVLSRSTTHSSSSSSSSSSMSSTLRRVRSLPGRGMKRIASNTSSVDSEASGFSRVRSNVSYKMTRLRGGGARFFGKLTGRSRSHEVNLDVVNAVGPCQLRHVSFAEQPELVQINKQRSSTRCPPRPSTPPPRLLPALVEYDGSDSDSALADEDIALLQTRRGVDDYMYARSEWWRNSDEYYALAFPWF